MVFGGFTRVLIAAVADLPRNPELDPAARRCAKPETPDFDHDHDVDLGLGMRRGFAGYAAQAGWPRTGLRTRRASGQMRPPRCAPARSRRCGATRRRRFAGSAASALPHGWTWPQRPLPEIGWLRAIVREMSVQDAALDQKRSQRRQFRLRDLIGVAHRPECAWEGKDG